MIATGETMNNLIYNLNPVIELEHQLLENVFISSMQNINSVSQLNSAYNLVLEKVESEKRTLRANFKTDALSAKRIEKFLNHITNLNDYQNSIPQVKNTFRFIIEQIYETLKPHNLNNSLYNHIQDTNNPEHQIDLVKSWNLMTYNKDHPNYKELNKFYYVVCSKYVVNILNHWQDTLTKDELDDMMNLTIP